MKLTDKKVRDGLNFIYKEYENNIVSKEEIYEFLN